MPESPDEKKFIREKIVKQPLSRRQIARRLIFLLLSAIIFGAVAAVSFALSRPVAEKYLGEKPTEPSIPITIEKDDEPGNQPSETETMAETTNEEEESAAAREELESVVNQAMESFPWTPENVDGLSQALREIGQGADKSVVTVSSVRTNVDWFDNPVESTGQYAGMIIAINPSEVVILTGTGALEEADSLRVTFGDGSDAPGTVKQRDTVAGMAALSVATAEISESTLNWVEAVELGNSYSMKTGDPVIAVGSPAGRVHSVKMGRISYVAKGVQTADGQTRILYTDFEGDPKKGTFFLNLSGELIGWATDSYRTEETAGDSMAVSISEYKGVLQKLTNGIPIPYFGIKGQDVTEPMQKEGIPKGVYITESIADGPAYTAGIQNGDILTKIQGEEIITIRDFQTRLEEVESGRQVTVVIARKGIEDYKEIEYTVTIGAR